MERITISARRGKKEFNEKELKALKLKIKVRLENGYIADATKKQIEALSKFGYRVKVHQNPDSIKIGKYVIKGDSTAPKISTKYKLNKNESEKWIHFLVKLIGPSMPEWVKEIQDIGFDVIEVIGGDALFICGDSKGLEDLRNLSFIEFIDYHEPAYKLQDELMNQNGLIKYVKVGIVPDEKLEEVSKSISSMNGKIIHHHKKDIYHYNDCYIVCELDKKQLNELSHNPYVKYLELDRGRPEVEGERETSIVIENLDATNSQPVIGYQAQLTNLGLSGQGVNVSICDSGVDNNANNNISGHLDLRGRQIGNIDYSGGTVTTDTNGHGTHVAGIAVGNAATGETEGVAPNNFLWGQGMAPQAGFLTQNATASVTTAMWRIFNWSILTRDCVNNGVSVMNNSWWDTVGVGAGYTQNSRTFDQLVRDPNPSNSDMENLTIVFSAGNSGVGATPGTITSPKEAKNLITVGNSLTFRPGVGNANNPDNIIGLSRSSSRGPAQDGRMLPTIVAPGTNVSSAISPGFSNANIALIAGTGNPDPLNPANTINQYAFASGTSMAAPHVTGLCALLVEWWRQRTNGFDPSPAMLKAMLINGAIDLAGGPNGTGFITTFGPIANIPNNDQGWGRVSLENIILQSPASDRGPKLFSDQTRAFTSMGQEHIIKVAVVDEARPMRITLVWTDAPGPTTGVQALMNDLDLEVTQESDGDLFLGNVFNNGFSVTGGAADNLNNIECVYVQNPAGIYEVRILAAAITMDARPPFDATNPWQDYALVIDNAEIVPENNVSVVPVIDRSGSMSSAGYVDITRFSSKAFVDMLGYNDELGIASFGTTASTDYADGVNIKDLNIAQDKEDAKDAIDGIAFGGLTNMGGGINEAKNLLDSATEEKAMILFTDGYDNKGGVSTNPSAEDAIAALPSDIKVYTCAMGPSSDQALLSQIASDTNGLYYYMPTIDDLFEIYNYIRGAITGDSIIANQSSFASHREIDAFVDSTASHLIVNVGWYNKRLNYTGDIPSRKDQIGIRLKDPRGRYINSNSSLLNIKEGEDYIIIKVNEPIAGNWKVVVDTKLKTHTRFTIGAFIDSKIKLHLPDIKTLDLGVKNLQIPFNVSGAKGMIGGLKVKSHLLSPKFSLGQIKKKFSKELKKIKIPKKNISDLIVNTDLTKINILNANLMKAGKADLLKCQKSNVRSSLASNRDIRRVGSNQIFSKLKLDNRFSQRNPKNVITKNQLLMIPELKKKGTHNLVIDVSGYSEEYKTKFVRKGMLSLNVR